MTAPDSAASQRGAKPVSAIQAQVLGAINAAFLPSTIRQVADSLLLMPSTARTAVYALERKNMLAAHYTYVGSRGVRAYRLTAAGEAALTAAFSDDFEDESGYPPSRDGIYPRCPVCRREQYGPSVLDFSAGKHPCPHCGHTIREDARYKGGL